MRRRNRWRVASLCAVIGIILLVSSITILLKSFVGESIPQPIAAHTMKYQVPISASDLSMACISFDNPVSTTVNTATIVDLKVAVCPGGNNLGSAATAPAPKVKVGGIVDAVADTTAPGATVNPIGNSRQTVDALREGTWSWKVTPTVPGEYGLAVVITALRDDGQGVLFRNERVGINLFVFPSVYYRINKVAASIGSILGVVGTLGGLGGIVALVKLTRDRQDTSAP